jgi:hypothetical protein
VKLVKVHLKTSENRPTRLGSSLLHVRKCKAKVMTEEEMQQQKKGKRQKTFLMGEWAQVSDNILEQSLTHSCLEKAI